MQFDLYNCYLMPALSIFIPRGWMLFACRVSIEWEPWCRKWREVSPKCHSNTNIPAFKEWCLKGNPFLLLVTMAICKLEIMLDANKGFEAYDINITNLLFSFSVLMMLEHQKPWFSRSPFFNYSRNLSQIISLPYSPI